MSINIGFYETEADNSDPWNMCSYCGSRKKTKHISYHGKDQQIIQYCYCPRHWKKGRSTFVKNLVERESCTEYQSFFRLRMRRNSVLAEQDKCICGTIANYVYNTAYRAGADNFFFCGRKECKEFLKLKNV